ncbi:MAG: acyl-CoA thioesterase [Bacteriovoracaceae bacterium]|jgi:acyl-CoA thioester hydrolase|nr:acyl-CoA thioesterase [Bacteriovoracaceae bacterium]
MTFKYEIQIIEAHLDSFGHVNNAVYLELFEQARWDFITKGKFGLDAILSKKQGPVILEVNIKYKRELKNRDLITIESNTLSDAAKIMQLNQKMINSEGKVACEAIFTLGFMDLEKRKLIMPPKDWLLAIGVSSY